VTHGLVIGTYTQKLHHVDGHAPGILEARFDGLRITDVRLAANVANPSWVTVSADGFRVYAVSETSPDGAILAFARSADGLAQLRAVSSGGAGPAHLALHPTQPFLLTGTYEDGTISVFRLGADGSPQQRTAFVRHYGRGPVRGRQDNPHVHHLSVDPVSGEVVVVDLGLGEVRWYALSQDGTLALRREATVVVGAGGPRHLVFHSDRRHALLVNELDNTLQVLRRDGERFTQVGTASTRPSDSSGMSSAGAIALSNDGRTVLVTNRGDDTVACFSFAPESSHLEFVDATPAKGRTPRDLIFNPEGDRVLVACQDSDEVAVFAFDARTRVLRFLDSSQAPTPVCLTFV
jgi:6-phosphogluconolactonase